MNHSYALIRESAGVVPTGIAVQWGNYEQANPRTGRPLTIPELCEFAADYLKVDYVFWSTQEPFYSERVIPHLKSGVEDGPRKSRPNSPDSSHLRASSTP
jgi:hypothetical protein